MHITSRALFPLAILALTACSSAPEEGEEFAQDGQELRFPISTVIPPSRFQCLFVTIQTAGTLVKGSGTGVVSDGRTGLTWLRTDWRQPAEGVTYGGADAYCKRIGWRLPTRSEARAISGANSCGAWPTFWQTWTSTPDTTFPNERWVVAATGAESLFAANSENMINLGALCVR